MMFFDLDKTLPEYLPERQNKGDAGYDLKARVQDGMQYKVNGCSRTLSLKHERDCLVLSPGERILIPNGLYLDMPNDPFYENICSIDTADRYSETKLPFLFEAQIRSRSGLANNSSVICLNAPATIDAGYRGEVMTLIYNGGDDWFEIREGDRIAQLVFSKVYLDPFRLKNSKEVFSSRGDQGFGSTGV